MIDAHEAQDGREGTEIQTDAPANHDPVFSLRLSPQSVDNSRTHERKWNIARLQCKASNGQDHSKKDRMGPHPSNCRIIRPLSISSGDVSLILLGVVQRATPPHQYP